MRGAKATMDVDRFEALEKKASELQQENARLRAHIARLLAETRGRSLGQEEQEIVELLAQAPYGLTAHDVALRLSMPSARAEHFLNRLCEGGHIAASGHYMTGHNTYYLTSRGTRHGVSHGFV